MNGFGKKRIDLNDKYVIVEGFAGLGNRLRTVAAAIGYAKKTGRRIAVDWSDGMFAEEGVNAFDLFFELTHCSSTALDSIHTESFYPKGFSSDMLRNNIKDYYRKKECGNFVLRKGINLCLDFLGLVHADNLRFEIAKKIKRFEPIGFQGESIVLGGELKQNIDAEAVVFLDNVPAYDKEILRKQLKLKADVQEKVDAFVKEQKLDQDSLGIHIRATDKKFHGSLDSLLNKIDAFIAKKGINRIFLCTDNTGIEEMMKAHYGDKLIVYPKFMPETGTQGMHYWVMQEENKMYKRRMALEAVLDMFILSQTEYMLYHLGSTFSEISNVFHRDSSKSKSWRAFQATGFGQKD